MKLKVDTRKKIFWIVCLLVILRVFASVPVPFSSAASFSQIAAQNSSLNFFNMLSGGGFSRLSVMALSISPYITASIVLQLMGIVIPRLHELQTGMADDRKQFEKITLITGIVLAAGTALAMAFGFARQGYLEYSFRSIAVAALLWTAGAAVSSVIGKKITDRYSVNGISLILLVNVVSSYIQDSLSLYQNLAKGKAVTIQVVVMTTAALAVFVLFVFVVILQESERRIPVQYAAKMGRSAYQGGGSQTIPIKLCPGSVVPVIFASSILATPGLIAAFVGKSFSWMNFFSSSHWFVKGQWLYTLGVVLYGALILFFSRFYGQLVFSPAELSERLKKHGGTIPGLRPGRPTEAYLGYQSRRVHALGAVGLLLIAVIPMAICSLLHLSSLSFFGTSVIITVGVLLELRAQIIANRQHLAYEHKGGIFGV